MTSIRTTSFSLLALALATCLLVGCGKKSAESPSATPTAPATETGTGKTAAAPAAASSSASADANAPLDAYRQITSGNDFMFLYYALSNIAPDVEAIAEKYSSEYRSSSDAFRKQDILKAIEPRINEEIAKAKTQRYFVYDIDQSLSHYDFAQKEFRLSGGLSPGSTWYISDNSTYTVQFANADAYQAIKVSDEAIARGIEKTVGSYGGFSLRVYAFAQDIDFNQKSVKAQIVKIKLLDRHGKELLSQ